MLDHAKRCAPAWQRGLLQRSRRLTLVKSVIAAKPIHHFMITDAPALVFEELEQWMSAFFWAGKEKVNGGQCLVAWSIVCRPTCLGGLGVRSLKLQGLVLGVRWEWLKRTDPARPWQGLAMAVDNDARVVFDSMVKIKVGDGTKVIFWRDRWVHGFSVAGIAHLIHALVDMRTRNRCMVSEGLDKACWLQDVSGDHGTHATGSLEPGDQHSSASPCLARCLLLAG